jgi:hypothetical protein
LLEIPFLIPVMLIFSSVHIKDFMVTTDPTVSFGSANPTDWSNENSLVDYGKH